MANERTVLFFFFLFFFFFFVKPLSHVQLTSGDCSLRGFSVHGIFQARVLEWVAISFSRELCFY